MKPYEEIILPESELETMNAIWAAEEALDRPIYTRDIMEYGTDYLRGLKMTTVLTLVSRLLYKQFIRIQKVGRSNFYTATVKHADYQKRAYRNFLEGTFRSDSRDLAAMLIADLSKEELAKAREIVTAVEK